MRCIPDVSSPVEKVDIIKIIRENASLTTSVQVSPRATQPNTLPVWNLILNNYLVGLGVTCSPRDPRFVDSNPAEVNGFFQDVKILSSSPPGGILSWVFRL